MSEQLTHWKLMKDNDYLGSFNMPQNGQEVILTIKRAESKDVGSGDGKKRNLIIHFEERGWKPMIVNNTNGKAITKVAKSKFIEHWAGVKIQLYVDPNVKAFGEIHEALRIRTVAPRIQEKEKPQPKMTITPEDISDTIFKLEAAETLEQLAATWQTLSVDMKAVPEVLKSKEECKTNLTPPTNANS
jgi:hypothetical protein